MALMALMALMPFLALLALITFMDVKAYCQAQFKFSPSSVQFELSLALSLIITTPTHPPGKVEMQLEIDHIYGQ